ncbi:hypothetical protein GCM10027589_06540 [Actinocorallia lasiicapitis]
MQGYPRVPQEVIADFQAIADSVSEDLELLGFAVTRQGDCYDGPASNPSGGVHVFYDSLIDSGGVYVTWKPSRDLVMKLTSDVDRDPSLAFAGGVAMDAIKEALVVSLKSLNWIVDSVNVGPHDSSFKVKSQALR